MTITVTPTPEQIAVAELNGWDPQELAENNARVARVHELMRKHSKKKLVGMAVDGGLSPACNPNGWTKQEIAAEVEEQEHRANHTNAQED